MKKSLLMKTMFLLCALVTGSTCAWATTVTKTVNTLVTELGWKTSSGSTINGLYTSFALDENITISTSGEPNCGSVWGTTAKDWRLYQNKSGDVTVTAASGYTISSVTFTYNVKNNGTLKDGTTTVASASEQTVNAASKTFTVGNTGSATNGQVQITQFSVTYAPSSSKEPAGLSFAIPSYKVPYNTEFTQTVTNPNGLTVTYASSDETIAIVDENSGEVLVGDKAGTVTITASSAETATYAAGEATYTITVFDANAKGTEKNPYTVTEALAVIDALASGVSTETVFVKGIVSTAPTSLTSGKAKYYISVDGTDADELYVYNGWGLDGAEFADASDIAVGDEVTVKGTLTNYQGTTPEFNKESIITQYKANGSTTEVKATTITADKYKTYVSTENLLVPAGVTAYIATGETASTLTLTSVAKIKKDTPVILFSETAQSYQFEITDEAVTYPAANLLKISDGTAVNGVFVLAKSGDNVGFYKWMGGALSAGRVYIDAPANAARDYLEFSFDGETTGIDKANSQKLTANSQYFDLQGRKVANPTKGLYIVNGKKVVIK
jgi:hypothetical protein